MRAWPAVSSDLHSDVQSIANDSGEVGTLAMPHPDEAGLLGSSLMSSGLMGSLMHGFTEATQVRRCASLQDVGEWLHWWFQS